MELELLSYNRTAGVGPKHRLKPFSRSVNHVSKSLGKWYLNIVQREEVNKTALKFSQVH